tara:strand:- start:4458 stop:4976 length:519 start_codon:yes stop_codon:yes gene_type:complete
MKLVVEDFLKAFVQVLACLLICCFCYFPFAKNINAESNVNMTNQQEEIKRSFESLRDLDYQTWQVIVYPNTKGSSNLVLRIVGFPGSLRFDHPTSLIINSGRKTWELKDITNKSQYKYETLNDSAAEFDIGPLIADLNKNRPLRLSLPGLINDLPIPPYLVSEWRTLVQKND